MSIRIAGLIIETKWQELRRGAWYIMRGLLIEGRGLDLGIGIPVCKIK